MKINTDARIDTETLIETALPILAALLSRDGDYTAPSDQIRRALELAEELLQKGSKYYGYYDAA